MRVGRGWHRAWISLPQDFAFARAVELSVSSPIFRSEGHYDEFPRE